MKRFPLRIHPVAIVLVSFRISADQMPTDDEGRPVIQEGAHHLAGKVGGAPTGELIFGGDQNPDQKKAALSLANLEEHFLINNIQSAREKNPKFLRIKLWLHHKSAGRKDGRTFAEWLRAGNFAREQLSRPFNVAIVHKNNGGKMWSFTLLDRMGLDRNTGLEKSADFVLVPVLAEEVVVHDEVDLGAVIAVESVTGGTNTAAAHDPRMGVTNLGVLLKEKMGIK